MVETFQISSCRVHLDFFYSWLFPQKAFLALETKNILTLKVLITNAADGILTALLFFWENKANDSHEMPNLILSEK